MPTVGLILLKACYDVEDDGIDNDNNNDEDRNNPSNGIKFLFNQLKGKNTKNDGL